MNPVLTKPKKRIVPGHEEKIIAKHFRTAENASIYQDDPAS